MALYTKKPRDLQPHVNPFRVQRIVVLQLHVEITIFRSGRMMARPPRKPLAGISLKWGQMHCGKFQEGANPKAGGQPHIKYRESQLPKAPLTPAEINPDWRIECMPCILHFKSYSRCDSESFQI